MSLILYPKNEKLFDSNGIGILSDAIDAEVYEVLNGQYELTVQYPIDGIHFAEIVKNAIITSPVDPVSDPQPFEIYRITKPMKGVVTIYARHVAYKLRKITVSPFSAESAPAALQGFKNNAVNDCPFEFWTDKSTAGGFTVKVPTAAWTLMGNSEGSILDTYGGEYEFDKWTVKLHNRRGADRGVSIRYGKNLASLEQDENCANVCTGVYPYWADMEGNVVMLPEKVVMIADEYEDELIMPLDLSQSFETAPTEEQLRAKTVSYIKANDIGKPDVSWTVEFVQLEQTEEYKGKALLERVLLGDTVSVVFPKLGVDVSARAVARRYKPLLGRHKNITLGKVKANIADTIVQQGQNIEKKPSVSLMQSIIMTLTASILGARGGAVRLLDTDGDGMPDTLYVADNADPALAKKVWRWNYEGWAGSKTGYNGPFILGATLEDGLLAEAVTAAQLVAGTIKSKDGKTFFLDLDNGILKMQATEFSISGKTVDEIAQEKADAAEDNAVGQAVDIAQSAVDSQTQQDIFNKWSDNGRIQGIYSKDGKPMLITHNIDMDLAWRDAAPCINAVQGDAKTRQIVFSLYSGGTVFEVPEDAQVLVRYKGPGVSGTYDTLPDGSPAAAISGSTVTVTLAPPVTATPGVNSLAITLIQGEDELTTFGVYISVQKNPTGGVSKSGDYNSVAGLIPAPSTARPGQHLMVTSVDAEGKITGVQAVDSIDGLMRADDGLVYLESNGEPYGNGLLLQEGGSGSGGTGEALSYTITMRNLLESRYITVAEGTAVVLRFNYASVDAEGYDDGPGIGRVIVGSATKQTFTAAQGVNEIDVTSFLAVGSNTVKVQVENSEGAKKTLPYTITVAAAYLTSNFDTSIPFMGGFQYIYTATGLAEKLMHFELDGVEIGTAVVTTSGRQQSYPFQKQPHGAHTIRAWFECEIEGTTVTSNPLEHHIICLEEGNTTKIISVESPLASSVEQYSNVVTKYRVYDPSSLTAAITLEVNGKVVNTLTVDRTEQTWTYRPMEVGELVQTIRCGDKYVSRSNTVTASSIDVEAETEALALHLSSYGRSNNEQDPGVWESGNIACEFQNFNFVSDGWLQDGQENTVCRVTGDARLHIPYKMFAYDFRTTGKTIEFEFATRQVTDYDAEVISCVSGGRGFSITAQQLRLVSEQSKLIAKYKEDEHIRVSFVVQKRSKNRLILCYLNGVMSGAVQYPDNDDFSQAEPVGITVGSNACTTDLYNIRVYDNDLTRHQILDNWIADTQDPNERIARYLRNNVYDAYGRVTMSMLPNYLCRLVIYDCPELPKFKGDKKTCSGYFVDLLHPERNFSFTNAIIDVQGTSSQYYVVKNLKINGKEGFILFDGTFVAVYAMNEDAIPVAIFTMKADVASSEGFYNTASAKLFNQYHPFKMPAQETDPRVRYSIDGFPIVIFWDNGTETKFLGKYNFNNDKGTPEPFGLTPGDERWEVLQNGTARVGFHSADFSDDSWKEDFEGNYPDGNTDISNLQPMCAWVTSTDTDQATGEAIDPVTYDGVEYTADTAEYRLAKFSAELGDHFVEPAVIYYKVFTLALLCMDQLEKNVLWRFIGSLMKWLADYYDADSIIGHNNQAQPVFDYWMEDIDYTESGDPVYNGQNSTFWKNLRATRADEIKAEWHRLRDAGFSYESVIAAFAEHKEKWPEAIYNEDMQVKCLDALEQDGDGTYLPFLRGDKWAWTQQWLYKRFRYLDSKYEYGSSLENRATIRTNVMMNMVLTYYMKMYGHTYYNNEHVVERVEKGVPTEFVSHADGAEDRVIGLNDPDMIVDLGDLSGHMVELIDLSKMIRLVRLILGSNAEGYINRATKTVTFGNNVELRLVNLCNCVEFSDAPDLSGCTNIEEVYLDGTAVTGVNLPNGGILRVLHLPETVANLTVRNQPKLTEFVMPNYSKVVTLNLENAGVLDGMMLDILNSMPGNSRVRLIGFDWEMTDFELGAFLTKLDSMRGLDENGNNTDLAQVSGRIYVTEINGTTLAKAEKYVGLTVEYGEVVMYSTRLVDRSLSSDYINDRATTIGQYALNSATALTAVKFTAAESVGANAFQSCSKLVAADFSSATSIAASAFASCSALTALILRGNTVCTLANTNAFTSAPIASDTGYIYVPAALVDSYKAATNWSTYADRIRAIEDYPDICN